MLCGTDPHPEHFRAKKYRIQEHFITRQDFAHIMRNLPEKVSEEDIEEMFSFADKDQDGKISYAEFQVMICPQQPRPDTAKTNTTTGTDTQKNKSNGKPLVQQESIRKHSATVTESNTEIKQVQQQDLLPLSLENIKLHDKITKNMSMKK